MCRAVDKPNKAKKYAACINHIYLTYPSPSPSLYPITAPPWTVLISFAPPTPCRTGTEH